MVTKIAQRKVDIAVGKSNGVGVMKLERLFDSTNMPQHLRLFSRATLEPGASVGFHVHHAETEVFYILSGHGEYCDDCEIVNVEAGDLTFTPDGHGHSLKNIGDDVLEFIAMIIKD